MSERAPTGASPEPSRGQLPIDLGAHPGLPRLLAALPELGIAVTPGDYLRIEQVFPAGRKLAWSEARALLADLIAKDKAAHDQITALFYRFIPPASAADADAPEQPESPQQPAPPPRAGLLGRFRRPPDDSNNAGRRAKPPRQRRIFLWSLLAALALALAVAISLIPPPEPPDPPPERDPIRPSAASSKPWELPSEPLAEFNSWVPVLERISEPEAPAAWLGLLLLVLALPALGWLLQRLNDLKRPNQNLTAVELNSDGPSVPAWSAARLRWPSALTRAQRRDLIWGVQRIAAEQRTTELDATRTVQRSARLGYPRLHFRRANVERSVWLWRDSRLRDPTLRALGQELPTLLSRAGLPLVQARFNGLPDPLWIEGEGPSHPEDLARPAREALVVILSDWTLPQEAVAKPQRSSPRVQRLLRELRAWPRVCRVTSDERGPDNTGIDRVPIAELPAWIGERPIKPIPHQPSSAGAEARWAALCALPGLPVTAAQCADLAERLGLPWDTEPTPPGAEPLGQQLVFPGETRRRLLAQLSDELWEARQVPTGAAEPTRIDQSSAAEHALRQALGFWSAELQALERGLSASAEPGPWQHSAAHHRGQIARLLLTLWQADSAARAQAIAELYTRWRYFQTHRHDPRGPAAEVLAAELRTALGALTARGLEDTEPAASEPDQPGPRIPLPWAWRTQGERDPAALTDGEPDPPGTARARLRTMGFAGTAGARSRPSPVSALALGLIAGLSLAAVAWFGTQVLIQPSSEIEQFALETPLSSDHASGVSQAFFRTAWTEQTPDSRLRAGNPKILRDFELPAGSQARLHWCWTGMEQDPNGPCAGLNPEPGTQPPSGVADPELARFRNNMRRTHTDDTTILLRAGTLAEPIRACAPSEDAAPWPKLSVAVIQSPPQYPAKALPPEQQEQTRHARQLAIRLLDSGGVDLAIVGPDWLKEAKDLARERAEPESQWLFFAASADALSDDAPPLPTAQAAHQALIQGDQHKLAVWLSRQVRGPYDNPRPDRTLRRPHTPFTAHVWTGQPRLWSGPARRTQTLTDGAAMQFVHICPGTFTMGSTELVERLVPGIVREVLELAADSPLADDLALDVESIGTERREKLQESLERAFGVSLTPEESWSKDIKEAWIAAKDLAMAKSAVGKARYDSGERPRHALLMDGFWIARTETTNAQLLALPAESLARRLPSSEERDALKDALSRARAAQSDLPAARISWHAATAVCAELGGHLASEAEWEYAARSGSRTAWSWGDDATLASEYAWLNENADRRGHAVASPQLWPNPLGLNDMHGNLWEWVQDCYDGDAYEKRRGEMLANPLTSECSSRRRVLRGGSFSLEPWLLRSAFRNWDGPELRHVDVGFRCVGSGAPAFDNLSP